MNILIADDEQDMLKILQVYFKKEGYNVFLAEDGEQAIELFYKEKIDLAILDWMMPLSSGLTVCKEIKRNSDTKVLMLTAKSEDEDELQALKIGADDYVRKPFHPGILITRAKKLLKEENQIVIGNLKVDFKGKMVFRNDENLNLTKKEIDLLSCLVRNRGNILSREDLLVNVWGIDYDGDDRTVDTHIRRLREKIGEDLIQTHRGLGYSLIKEI
ncbi:response regulator transcription factor [Bacillus sp. AFS017336]|uniref:response regulator transcription factor n=1 Tax=Bacillus sp. AFS017336 TaxID=2033489 RepID=UPI000BF052C6|nr:response regulator transcription factor [Bacillus sp. AFS017336]PEL13757.1 DNA-binding response regulator [Bacillus sp. AFS017336]